METPAPETSRRHRFDATTSWRMGCLQFGLGMMPATLGVLVLLGSAWSLSGTGPLLALEGIGLWRIKLGFWLALAGLFGLVWGALPAKRWEAIPVILLLLCGFAAVAVVLWPIAGDGFDSSLYNAQLAWMFVIGPILIGGYQACMAMKRLVHRT